MVLPPRSLRLTNLKKRSFGSTIASACVGSQWLVGGAEEIRTAAGPHVLHAHGYGASARPWRGQMEAFYRSLPRHRLGPARPRPLRLPRESSSAGML